MIDHSCRHDLKREDRINANLMNVGRGERQRIMHNSKMTKTCFGEFVSGGFSIRKVGDTKICFTSLIMLVHMKCQ